MIKTVLLSALSGLIVWLVFEFKCQWFMESSNPELFMIFFAGAVFWVVFAIADLLNKNQIKN